MYTINHFIKKFSEIPEEKWCSNALLNKYGQKCAFGFCCNTHDENIKDMDAAGAVPENEEATALKDLTDPFIKSNSPFIHTYLLMSVNDGKIRGVSEKETPKERVLEVLNNIKQKQINDTLNSINWEPEEEEEGADVSKPDAVELPKILVPDYK